jgi:hypothetical protein
VLNGGPSCGLLNGCQRYCLTRMADLTEDVTADDLTEMHNTVGRRSLTQLKPELKGTGSSS